jgi:subtilisin-like proprotein convertase family protein
VYAIYHPERPSFPLNVAAAGVLPLQGVWNCGIYLTVNKVALKGLFGVWRLKLWGDSTICSLQTIEQGNTNSIESTSANGNISIESEEDEKLELWDALANIG